MEEKSMRRTVMFSLVLSLLCGLFAVKASGAQNDNICFSFPNQSGNPGTQVVMGLQVSNADSILAAQGAVTYPQDQLEVVSVAKTDFSTGMTLVTNLNTPGLISVAMAGANAVSGSGDLFRITFKVKGKRGQTANVILTSIAVNDVSYTCITNGSIKIPPYIINATAGAHGTISPSGTVEVVDGANQSFTISPADHYHVSDVLVDTKTVGAVTSYTFTNVTADHTISASFAIDVAYVPTLNTPTSVLIGATTATLGATISSNGGGAVTESGVVYATASNPDITTGIKVATSPPVITGIFTVNATGLTPNTLYHYRGYATNWVGTGYAADSTFTTVSNPPTATAATGVSSAGFTANWAPPAGTATVTGYRLDVATDSNFTSFISGYNSLPVSGTSQAVTGLTPATPYYYRVRAVNAGGTSANSNTILATTSATWPTVDTPTSGSITTTTATLGATIRSNAGAAVTGSGVAYGIDSNPDTSGSKVTSTATSGAFTVNTTGLTPNTLYHYRGYAINSMGTGYTADSTFTTLSDPPTAGPATGVGSTGFTANWTAPGGTATITGYRLDVSTNPNFTTFVVGYNNLPVAGMSQAVTGLAAGTPYYYRVRAVNAGGTSASSGMISVTTLNVPTVDTPTSGSISTTTATLGATIGFNGGAAVTGSGVAYGTNSNPDVSGSKVTSTTTSGTFTVNATGLSANTLYHYRGYATNSVGPGYTADSTFTTVSGPPTATAATGITSIGFRANWTTPSGNGVITGYRLDVAADPGFASFIPGYNDLSVSGTSQAVTGLAVDTPYYYRVRAVNAGGTSTSSNTIAATTSRLPTVDTPTSGSIGTTTAKVGATISSDGGLTITGSGVAYGTTSNPDITNASKVATNPLIVTGAFTINATGLSANTLYHYRGYATNSGGTGYTADSTFTTIPNPLTATAATGVGSGGFTANWSAPSGTAAITGYQLDVATNSNFTSFVSGYNNLAVSGTSQAVTGLAPGTPYYYRVRAVNAGGASGSSNTIHATTSTTLPTVDTPTSGATGTNTATLGATISSNGGLTITGSGVAYGTNSNPDISGSKVATSPVITNGVFTVNAGGLTSNTLYHYRGYATNSLGPGYTGDSTFTTISNPPTATAATGESSIGFTANWTAPSGAAAITGYRLDVATDSGFTSFVPGYNDLPVAGTSQNVTGLAASTPYYYRVRAVNAGGTSAISNTIAVTTSSSPIIVVSPNGGETCYLGAKQAIIWSYVGNPGQYVKIELLKDGSVVSTISARTPIGQGGNGSYNNWTIPMDLVPGGGYRVRITSTTNSAFTDISDRDFTIAGPIISITAPNGGEVWETGSRQIIRWSFKGNPGTTVMIELLKGSSVVSTIKAKASAGNKGSGSFNWLISKNLLTGSDYKIRVTSTKIPSSTDTSDNSFTILAPEIKVESPSGGESWAAGSKQTITWSYVRNPGAAVRIELFKGGSFSRRIIASTRVGTGGMGSYIWPIPAALATGDDYTIKITSTSVAVCTDTSDNPFSIVPPVAKSSAGPDQTLAGSAPAKLSGANSVRIQGGVASLQWTQIDGSTAVLSDEGAVEPTFVTPDAGIEGQSLSFELTVIGKDGSESKDSCIVNVTEMNFPPIADAAVNQTVVEAGIVTLDASHSTDPEGGQLTVFWKQLAGAEVTLSDPKALQPTFVAPGVGIDGDSLIFELTVTDAAGLRSRDTCIVNVTSMYGPPKAKIGVLQTVLPGSLVTLDGSTSADQNGNTVRFHWKQTAGKPVTLSNPEVANPTFVAPEIEAKQEKLIFQLTVTGSSGLQDKEKVTVTVQRKSLR